MDSGKRTPREDLTRHAKRLMQRLIERFRARLDEELKPKKVTTAQLRFLKEVHLRPGATGAQLARACAMTPQSAQAMLVRAVERGWVVRGKDAENGRLVTATVTPAGERLLKHALEIVTRMEAEMWAGVPMKEIRSLNDVLERGLANLES